MSATLTRRAFGATAAAVLATPFIRNAEAAAPIELRCSLDTEPSHPRNVGFRDFLAKIEKGSNGEIKTRLFESGALFPDLHVVKALVQGQVEMACPGTWTVTGFVPDADFSQLPAFYGRPIDVVHKVTDGPAGKFVNAEMTKKLHLETLGAWFDLGFNNWYSTKKPLDTLADLKGMKLRSPGGVLNSWRIKFFDGIPNVTAWPDVPLAMSQGTFDGLITTNASAASSKLYDSGLRHSLQDQQGMGLYVPLVNQTFWAKIGKKNQEMILSLWAENLPTYRKNTAAAQDAGRASLTKQGVKFVDVPQSVLDATRAKMLPRQNEAVSGAHISPALVKLVMADIGA
ncbi:MAG: TRAP transporter substrate-binding protein DctP [Rhodospirillales bacterium]|nr:TRAP transporter substrate-binding protein DctP [Rhodospirillales bacterium]